MYSYYKTASFGGRTFLKAKIIVIRGEKPGPPRDDDDEFAVYRRASSGSPCCYSII